MPGSRTFLHFRGHGASATPDDRWEYADLAAELWAVADHVGARQALGISLGAGALCAGLASDPTRFDRLVLVLGGLKDRVRSLTKLASVFGDGPVVHGPPVGSVFEAKHSADRANAGLRAASAWPQAPRPTPSEDLWPERALNGDPLALQAMVDAVWAPLAASSTGLVDTLTTYLSVGHSLEASARELFVHVNTVRYRLRRVSDITGWDPLLPRDAFVLHCAVLAGRLNSHA